MNYLGGKPRGFLLQRQNFHHSEFVHARRDEFEVCSVFETCVFGDLLVVLMTSEVHPEVRVVVIRRELRADRIDQLLAEFLGIDAALAERFHPDTVARISRIDSASCVWFLIGSHGSTTTLHNGMNSLVCGWHPTNVCPFG